MKRMRVAEIEAKANWDTYGLKEIARQINQEFMSLEQDGNKILNIIPCQNKGFLILYKEPDYDI